MHVARLYSCFEQPAVLQVGMSQSQGSQLSKTKVLKLTVSKLQQQHTLQVSGSSSGTRALHQPAS